MSQTAEQSVRESLLERCRLLGWPLWTLEARPATILEPQDQAHALCRSPMVRDGIKTALFQAMQSTPIKPASLWPGAWVIFGVEMVGRIRNRLHACLLFTADGLSHASFAEACRQLGRDPTTLAGEMIGSICSSAEIRRAELALQWFVTDFARAASDQRTIEQFSEKLTQSYEEIQFLFRMARLLDSVATPAEMLQQILPQLHQVWQFGWVAFRFGKERCVPELSDRLFIFGNEPVPHDQMHRLTEDLVNGQARETGRILQPEHCELAKVCGQAVLAERIRHDDRRIGVLLASNMKDSLGGISSVELQFAEALSRFLGVFHENVARFVEQRELFFGTIRALTASIDAKDRYTRGHSERVALLATNLAAAIGLSPAETERYRIAGLVHDVGKIGVPEAVLLKPGKLTDEEFGHIKLHPLTGYIMLKDIPSLADVLPGVLHHHERYDGRGYPHGLAGENIPLMARVLALADTFDAMSSRRSYRDAMPREKVIGEIRRCAGSQFDPALTEKFVQLDMSAFDAALQQHAGESGLSLAA